MRRQTFNPDVFGKLKRSGTISFNGTYTSTRRVSTVGGFIPTYDAKGNLTKDGTAGTGHT